MPHHTHDHLPSSSIDDDNVVDLSSVILGRNDDSLSKNEDKEGNTVLEKFFHDVTAHADGTKSAKCVICKAIVKQSTSSTFNYGRHVQRKHQKAFEAWKSEVESRKAEKPNQPTIQESFSQRSKKSSTSFGKALCRCLVDQKYNTRNTRQMELTKMIVNDLIVDLGLPLSIVERPAFLRAMKTVDPKFSVLSRRSLSRDSLPTALESVMTKVKKACDDAKFVALTLDVWSDRRMRSFIAITMHTVAETDASFQNYLLTFQPLCG